MIVQPVWAKVGEVVVIHWRLTDGRVWIQKVTAPPKDVLETKLADEKAIAEEESME